MHSDKNNKYILHVDGDNFFVSCELARFPHLKGKPVIVGEERGIASAMSPEAKKIGITRGMPVFQIKKDFPQVTILPAHFELYEQYNDNLYKILSKYSHCVERYSIDECFAVIEDPHIASTIKREAEMSLGITLSFGIARTKTLAKVASKKEKPSGLVFLLDDSYITETLKNTPIGSIWGIGRAISSTLTSFNIKTAYEFVEQGSQFVKKNFGSNTLDTWYELKGMEMLPVEDTSQSEYLQKSFQSTKSFGYTTKERSFLLSELCNHAEILCKRLRVKDQQTNRFSFFLKNNSAYNRYSSLEIKIGFYTNNPTDITRRIIDSFDNVYKDWLLYKATGISIYSLKPTEMIQNDLFGTQKTLDDRNDIYKTIDDIEAKLGGEFQLHLLSSLKSRQERHNKHLKRNLKNKFIYGLPLPYMGEAI